MENYENKKNSLKRKGYVLIPNWLQSNCTEVDLSKLHFDNLENRINLTPRRKLQRNLNKNGQMENSVRIEGVKISDERVLEYVLNTYIIGNGKLTEFGDEDKEENRNLQDYLSETIIAMDKYSYLNAVAWKKHEKKAKAVRSRVMRESNSIRFTKSKFNITIKDLVTEEILNSACNWCITHLNRNWKLINPDINYLLEVWAAYNYLIFTVPPNPSNTYIIQYFEEVPNQSSALYQVIPILSKLIVDLYGEDASITETYSAGHLQLYNKGSFITPHHDGKYSDENQGAARIVASFIYLNDQIEGKGGELVLRTRTNDTITYKPKFGDIILLDCYYDVCIQHEIKPSYWERYGYVSFSTVPIGDKN